MKKISISGQLVILFLFTLLISASAFTIITLTRVSALAVEETYSRLITYSTLVANHQDYSPELEDFRDMEVALLEKKKGIIFYSKDISMYINEEDYAKIIEIADEIREPKVILTRKITNYRGDDIYYVLSSTDFGQNFLILMTNSIYVSNMVKTLSLQLILIFITIICLSILCIATWSNRFAKRLHLIQDHILSLPKGGYDYSYIDSGLDEIGELSRAVESMRIEICQSERTKQEMLQNLSHDFKTPIAVIKSYAEAQQDGMADEDSSKIIIAQAEILKHKVNRLLQYNSLEYLSKDREFEDVVMSEVIREVIQGYKFQTDLIIDLDLSEDVVFKGYRENYSTVIDNIVDNARRYAKTEIKIILKKDRLRIYNDGDHIDKQFLNGIFKPYEKGSRGEFGLGMSIVKKTVEFFGMELIVKNETVGVSFIITKTHSNER